LISYAKNKANLSLILIRAMFGDKTMHDQTDKQL